MRRLLLLLVLLLVGCETDGSQPSSGDGMTPDRHCLLAVQLAKRGDCLGSGEHLAFCAGRDAAIARLQATKLCDEPKEPPAPPAEPEPEPEPAPAPKVDTSRPEPGATSKPTRRRGGVKNPGF